MEGNIIIYKENVPFEMVSKALINDDSIDAMTLGIYVKILGLNPNRWNLNINGLASKLKLSVPKIKTAFAILERTGYLLRIHIKNDAGRYIGYEYHIGNVPFPEDQRTNVVADCSSKAKNQPLENATAGQTSNRETQPLEKPAAEKSGGINKYYTESKTKEEEKTKFNFRDALLGLGISTEVVDTWLEVRRRRKATNSELAFKDLCTEIAKSGQPAEECIRIAAVNSWCGFKAEYLRPRNIVGSRPQPRQESVFEHNARIAENIRKSLMGGTPYDEQ